MYVTISHEEHRPAPLDALACRRTQCTKLEQGAYLYFEGDEVDRLYQIESGVVRLTRVLEDGRRQVISFGYPGDIIGFPAHGLHHTDCDALIRTTLTPIPRLALDNCKLDPKLHAALMGAAMNEISAMQDHFMMLGRKSAAEKLASFLRVLLDRIGEEDTQPPTIDLPMSRSDIADFLGLTTETISRCFTALRKSGVIRLNGFDRVEVLDRHALAMRADGKLS